MDSRERVQAALRGSTPDRVPCALGFFSQPLFGADDADELFATDVRFVEFDPPPGQDGFVDYLDSLPPDVHVGSISQLRTYHEWRYRPDTPGRHLLRGVRSAAELVEGLLPDLVNPARGSRIPALVEGFHARGLAVAALPPHLGGELFEAAYRLRGFELFMEDLLARPALVDYVLDQLTDMLLENTLVLVSAGIDVLLLDDDVASCAGLLMSPATWRRFFKPRLARVIDAVREATSDVSVFYHSDGDFSRLIPDLVELGVDVVNPVQPDCMDPREIKRAYGDRLALWGTIGTARLWGEGRPDQVREEVRKTIDMLGRSGLLLSPAYDVDFAPRANLEAFVGAVREFG